MSASVSPTIRIRLREKLERLMLFRVLMVTLLLGSAIVVNINDVASFTDPSYLAIFTLIIGTYVATIIYAVLVTRLRQLDGLAYAQLVVDVLVAGGLVYVTGGTQSVFAFLFYLSIINGAILMGRRAAFVLATLCSVTFLGMLLVQLNLVPGIRASTIITPSQTAAPVYSVAVNIVAYYLVGLLAGYLAQRLEEQDTELERKQLDIWELQALNQHILSSITSGVVTLDKRRRVLFLNRAAEELLGRTIEQLYGQRADEHLLELRAAIGTLLEPSAEADGGTPEPPPVAGASLPEQGRWEGWVERGEAEALFLVVSHSRLYDGKGEHYGHILTIQDQTLIHRMQQRVQRQERLAVVGQLAAGIAHEIRNPLASMSGSIEMLQMFLDAGEDEERLMRIVLREIDRLNLLISDFLEYTRDRRPTLGLVSPVEVILETIELFRHDAELTQDLKIDVDLEACRPLELMASADGLKQIFWNLLRNAAQALDGQGRISLEARAIAGDRQADGHWDHAKEVPTEQAQAIRFVVADDGPGIPAAIQERLFEPFFTTKKGGTGLGLATIYRIVEDHDGSIGVETSEQGTRFVIDLPLRRSVAEPTGQTDPMLGALVRPSIPGSLAPVAQPEVAAEEPAPQEPFRWK